MTEREISGEISSPSLIDLLADGLDADGTVESGLAVLDYVELALRSGFPEALRIGSQMAREHYLEGYVSQVTTRDVTGTRRARDPVLLRRFLGAYAINSAGVAEAKTIYDAAGINKHTAAGYEHTREAVFVLESVPAWSAGRLKRLARAPKRYVADPGLMAAVLRLDKAAIMRDGNMLGRLLDTFVLAQLPGEITVSRHRPRLAHLRQRDGGHEVDIVIELGGGELIGFEVKAAAAAAVTASDARHLAWLERRDRGSLPGRRGAAHRPALLPARGAHQRPADQRAVAKVAAACGTRLASSGRTGGRAVSWPLKSARTRRGTFGDGVHG